MNDSAALVTGANKGIGMQIARQLAAAGLTGYVGSRDPVRGQRRPGVGQFFTALTIAGRTGLLAALAAVLLAGGYATIRRLTV